MAVRSNQIGQGFSMMLSEVLVGLSQKKKSINSKYLYDTRGSEIFERICEVSDYYPAQAEKEILKTYGHEMSEFIGANSIIIEPGCGNGEKTKILLSHLDCPLGYVPIEISQEILERMVQTVKADFPDLLVSPMHCDFLEGIEHSLEIIGEKKCVVFFPGSTIGNFSPDEVVSFLKKIHPLLRNAGGFLVGVDLKKDSRRILKAYDDSEGITANFNLNLLHRLNRELHANFDSNKFYHKAIYNEDHGRVEMHLVSKSEQLVRVNQTVFRFWEGETIHTENSYKYLVDEFILLCGRAKLKFRKLWMDKEQLFCVYYFEL